MHHVVQEILKRTKERLVGLPEVAPRVRSGDRRDLVRSAETIKRRGMTPIIAEIKPRVLGRKLTFDEISQYADLYTKFGACGVSVLTEETYFMGSPGSISIARNSTKLPVLRKDFILDERQLNEAEADLVLLIAGITPRLGDMVDAVRGLGMEPLVEAHTVEELRAALDADAGIIGINNRSLKTLEVDLSTFERLGPVAKSAGVFLVAESGVYTRGDASRMVQAGADALLVGTSLMKEPERLVELNGMGCG